MENQPLQKVGYGTKRVVIYKSESHKLHQAFAVAKGATIIPGQPVYLMADGTVTSEASVKDGANTVNNIYLGIAMTSSLTPAYPSLPDAPEVTVMVQGMAIVHGTAAAANTNPGYVTPGELDNDGYVKYTASTAETNFINITAGAAEGDLIQVLVK